jgi:hypothetical protein
MTRILFLLSLLLASPAWAVTYETFDPATIGGTGGNPTLSNGNLTITNNNGVGANVQGATVATGEIAGKYHFEFTFSSINGITTLDAGIAIGNNFGGEAAYAMSGVNFRPRSASDAQIVTMGSAAGVTVLSTGPCSYSFCPGDTIGIDLDLIGHTATFTMHGTGNFSPVTVSIPTMTSGGFYVHPIANTGATNDVITANFGPGGFALPVPPGYTAGWPVNPVLSHGHTSFTNSSYNSTYIVPYDGNLTNFFTVTTATAYIGAVAPAYCQSGKVYIEATTGPPTDFNGNFYTSGLGIVKSPPANFLSEWGGAGVNSVFVTAAGYVNYNGSQAFSLNGGSLLPLNTIIEMAYDATDERIWFRIPTASNSNWNGNAANSPTSPSTGLDISTVFPAGTAAYPIFLGADMFTELRANFGDSAFVGAVPSGYAAGWSAVANACYPSGTGGSQVLWIPS